MTVIYVKKEHPTKGNGPIEWFLITNEPVHAGPEAYEYVGYYMQRWEIERFHYVLKRGCAIEKLQERSIDKTAALILMYSIIAVMILNVPGVYDVLPARIRALRSSDQGWQNVGGGRRGNVAA
jgi:hypothetical protein